MFLSKWEIMIVDGRDEDKDSRYITGDRILRTSNKLKEKGMMVSIWHKKLGKWWGH